MPHPSARGKAPPALTPTADPIVYGRLHVYPGRLHTPPTLSVLFRCPWCRRQHEHGLPADDAHPGVELHRVSHCLAEDAPPAYTVRLDPAAWPEHARLLVEFRRQRTAWQRRQAQREAAAADATPAHAHAHSREAAGGFHVAR